MRFFRPRFVVATLQTEPQTRLRSKLGGRPWGFPVSHWPFCRECTRPMALVAQLLHDPPMLDLGNDNYVLHLFQCPTAGCSSYECDAGCTAGLVLSRHDLGDALIEAPRDTHPTGQIYVKMTGPNVVVPEENWTIPLNGELWLSHWEQHDDEIPPDKLSAFFDNAAFDALPARQRNPFGFDSRWHTKTGSAPYWGGNGVGDTVERVPQPPFAFLMQINESIPVAGPVPAPDAAGCDIVRCERDGKSQTILRAAPSARRVNAPLHISYEAENEKEYWVSFANFGGGSAYVFTDRHGVDPRFIWFWSK
jgi:hypothetical protein